MSSFTWAILCGCFVYKKDMPMTSLWKNDCRAMTHFGNGSFSTTDSSDRNRPAAFSKMQPPMSLFDTAFSEDDAYRAVKPPREFPATTHGTRSSICLSLITTSSMKLST